MSKNITVSVNSLSKIYRLYESKYDFFKDFLNPFDKTYHKTFHALKNISFAVEKGEVLGIIGKNGSGKSTLLKVLANIVTPTSGEYYCKGKVTALLELSGGFNHQLTGVQNIEFLGELQGFTKNEMKERTKLILDFAEIGEYANQPIKSYSSGMYMRLAFSLAIHIDPDILIVDEILGVGDLRFQNKCFERIKEFKEAGKTIILCSHNLNAVKSFCSRAIWIHEGVLIEDGNPVEVSNHYNAFMITNRKNNN